jgi:hypothetical protein
VARGGTGADAIVLYLLRGSKLSVTQQSKTENRQYGRLDERDVEAILFPIHEGKSVSFQFAEIVARPWSEMKSLRIGRVLPPYLTRLQERFSAYFQRPGLNRYPDMAFQAPAIAATPVPAELAHPVESAQASKVVSAVTASKAPATKIPGSASQDEASSVVEAKKQPGVLANEAITEMKRDSE